MAVFRYLLAVSAFVYFYTRTATKKATGRSRTLQLGPGGCCFRRWCRDLHFRTDPYYLQHTSNQAAFLTAPTNNCRVATNICRAVTASKPPSALLRSDLRLLVRVVFVWHLFFPPLPSPPLPSPASQPAFSVLALPPQSRSIRAQGS